MNTPVNLIFQKFDELDSTVEFVNWLISQENELLKTEKNMVIHAFDQGNTTFFNNVASDGIEYFDTTYY